MKKVLVFCSNITSVFFIYEIVPNEVILKICFNIGRGKRVFLFSPL